MCHCIPHEPECVSHDLAEFLSLIAKHLDEPSDLVFKFPRRTFFGTKEFADLVLQLAFCIRRRGRSRRTLFGLLGVNGFIQGEPFF